MDAELEEPVVNPRDMTVKELVIRLDGKVTAGLGVLTEGQSGLRADVTDHETRIRALEARPAITWKQLAGIVGGLGTVVTLITTFVSHVKIT